MVNQKLNLIVLLNRVTVKLVMPDLNINNVVAVTVVYKVIINYN